MRNLYIGHSYQKKTKSTDWLIELIRKHSTTLDVIWDEEWIGGAPVSTDDILRKDYDRIFIFQLPYLVARFAAKIPDKLIYIPMYDAAVALSDSWWSKLSKVSVLNLSWTLHSRLQNLGLNSLHTQYFPDSERFAAISDFSTLRGFFWRRRKNVGWPVVRTLISNVQWKQFVLHDVPDPDPSDIMTDDERKISAEDAAKFHLTITGWEEDKSFFEKVAQEANVFFAPRRLEGIGMSFLEAMARGQCVVAPNFPTHSEYITHNVSGLLYDPDRPEALDYKRAEELGAAARRHMEYGYARWQNDLHNRLPEFLFSRKPNGSSAGSTFGAWAFKQTRDIRPGTKMGEGKGSPEKTSSPLVTIAIVARNASKTFENTLRSILWQTYPNLEIVVVDGASTDGTQKLIQQNEAHIDHWISEPDEGPYEGMNKAVRMAKGRWILFMNSGDFFYTSDAIEKASTGVPDDSDFIVGHHIYRSTDGVEYFHKANNFDDTWRNLKNGTLSTQWLVGVPCHQATFTRTTLIKSHGGYDSKSYPIAADHEFMYRMRQAGAKFYHCDEIVSIYSGGGLSAQHWTQCQRDWWRIARKFGPTRKVDDFFLLNFSAAVNMSLHYRIFRYVFILAPRKLWRRIVDIVVFSRS